MDEIKNFRRDCCWRLTSFGKFAHRFADRSREVKKQRRVAPASCKRMRRRSRSVHERVRQNRGAVEESSPRRKPWGYGRRFQRAPEGRKHNPLARGHGQEPHQKSEKDHAADHREYGVQGVEVEVGIPIQARAGRQHKTSMAQAKSANGRLSGSILALFKAEGSCFLRSCVTPFECLKRLPWLPARPAALDC